MFLHELPELVLHKICLKLAANDITSLQDTNLKLYTYIRSNRHHYSRYPVLEFRLTLSNGERIAEVKRIQQNGQVETNTIYESVDSTLKSTIPSKLISYDHDELANMHIIWWKRVIDIELYEIVDYRRYLPHFDRCKTIFLRINTPMKLSEMLASMETKNLDIFSVSNGIEIECTAADLRKIGTLSSNIRYLHLGKLSDSTNISNDDILDMIQIGSFAQFSCLEFSRIQDNMLECLGARDWVVQSKRIDRFESCFLFETTHGSFIRVQSSEQRENDLVRRMLDRVGNINSWRGISPWEVADILGDIV